MAAPDLSVIVASYNQPNALRLALAGFAAQSDTDFELVVADDGSAEPTRELVDRFGATAPFPTRFLTQEDRGFRKATMLNAAIQATQGRQVLFTDGDCVPLLDLVAAHKRAFGPRSFCAGGQVKFTCEQTRTLSPEAVTRGEHERMLSSAQRRQLRWNHLKNRFHLLVGKRDKPKTQGANFSADRRCLLEVDGFDESYNGMGGEDSDLRNRLRNLGARPVSLWACAVVCHLEPCLDARPPTPWGPRKPKDRQLYNGSFGRVRALKGLSAGRGREQQPPAD